MAPGSSSTAVETVLTFLESVGRRSEAESYLRLFRQLPKQSFAVITVGPQVFENALGSLVEQVKFLSELGLYAPLALGVPGDCPPGAGQEFCELLAEEGVDSTLFAVDGLDPRAIEQALCSERMPVLAFSGAKFSMRERFRSLTRLTQALNSRKVVVLRWEGGIGPHGLPELELHPGYSLAMHAGGISVVNLRVDWPALQKHPAISTADSELVEQLEGLLRENGRERLTVSVAAPLDLLRELFTVRGAGTLIKLGSAIERHPSFETVDLTRLERLLGSSFGRAVRPGVLDRSPLAVYLEASYRGVALLESSTHGAFLSKFAVEPVAQGEGIGQDLWRALIRDHSRVFWRARPNNPIRAWYLTLCDGMLRLPDWHVFWRGISSESIASLVEEARSRPIDFVDVGTS